MFLKPTINPTLEFPTASWVVTGPRWSTSLHQLLTSLTS